MYCQNHDALGCTACMATNHRLCQDVSYIPDLVKKNPQASDPTDIAKRLESLTKSLQEIQKTMVEEKNRLQNSRKEEVKKIQDFRKEMNERLDELEKMSLEDIDRRFQAEKKKIEDATKTMDDIVTRVNSAENNVKFAGANESQLFVSIKRANEVVCTAERKIKYTTTECNSTGITFTAEQRLITLLTEMKTLDYDSSLTYNTDIDTAAIRLPLVEESVVSNNQITVQKTATTRKIDVWKKYSVKDQSDIRYCTIYGVCELNDGTILIADFTFSKLKRLKSSTYTIQDWLDIDCPKKPCAINNNTIAVLSVNNIKLIAVADKMQITRTIELDMNIGALGHANERLYLSDDNSAVINVYTLSSGKLDRFSKDHNGKTPFDNIGDIVVSSDSSKLYVADHAKGFSILDRNGMLIHHFNGIELGGACSICLYNENVLVSGLTSNIVEFSTDGEIIGTLVKANGYCLAMCHHKYKSKLITCYRDNDEIALIDL